MKEVFLCIFTFVLVYLFYIIFVYKRKNVLSKFKDGKEIRYLKYKYKVKITDSNFNKLAHTIFLANSFILSTTVTLISLFNNLILELIIGIVILVILILLLYHIIGKIYGRR